MRRQALNGSPSDLGVCGAVYWTSEPAEAAKLQRPSSTAAPCCVHGLGWAPRTRLPAYPAQSVNAFLDTQAGGAGHSAGISRSHQTGAMVAKPRRAAPTAVDTMTPTIQEDLELLASPAGTSEPAAPRRNGGSGRGPRQHALFVALFSYLAWFALIIGGILAYEGGVQAVTCLHLVQPGSSQVSASLHPDGFEHERPHVLPLPHPPPQGSPSWSSPETCPCTGLTSCFAPRARCCCLRCGRCARAPPACCPHTLTAAQTWSGCLRASTRRRPSSVLPSTRCTWQVRFGPGHAWRRRWAHLSWRQPQQRKQDGRSQALAEHGLAGGLPTRCAPRLLLPALRRLHLCAAALGARQPEPPAACHV